MKIMIYTKKGIIYIDIAELKCDVKYLKWKTP